MHKFKELLVWKKSMDFTVTVYQLTKILPTDERFGLISQLRRSCISIGSNIAEGAGRNTKGEFNQFLGIATGSAFEVQTQLELLVRLGFVKYEDVQELIVNVEEIQKMLYNLMKSLK